MKAVKSQFFAMTLDGETSADQDHLLVQFTLPGDRLGTVVVPEQLGGQGLVRRPLELSLG